MSKVADDLSKILGDAAGKKSKLTKGKKIIIAVVAIILVAAIVISIVLGVRANKKNDNEPVYREYKATRGDIIVGLTESSVITLNKENITFPVGAEVVELYVKSGSSVNEGDPLAKLSVDDISEALAEYETEIESAALNVENAKLSKKNELLKAEQTMNTSILNGTLSDSEYSSAVKQAETDLENAQKSVDEAQEKYDDLVAQSKTFSADLLLLTLYETKMNGYQETVDFWTKQKNERGEVSSDLSKVQSSIKSIADASNMEQAEAILAETKEDYEDMHDRYYNGDSTTSVSGMGSQQSVKYSELLKAEEKYKNMEASMDELESLFAEKERLEAKLALYDEDSISNNLSDAEENLSESKEDYNEFSQDFTEKYGNVKEKEDMEKAVSDALDSLNKAKLSLEKQQTNYQTALLSAEQKKESTDSTAANAQKEYDLKVIELNQKVTDAQKQYDNLVEELSEIKETIGNDGVVTASCSGIISSLNVEVGDEISVSSGGDAMGFSSSSATLMTITDMSEVNVSISISEDDILDISLDQEAVVSLAAFPDDTFDAVVDSISVEGATIGAASVSYTVNVKFTNDGTYELYDGMSADVTLIQGSARDVIYINEQAVTTKDGKSTVMLKGSDGNGVETAVTTGFSDGQYVEIMSGLNEGDTVLVQSAIGGGESGNSGGGKMPDMGEMPDFGSGEMPDMGNFNPGEMMR